MGQYRPGCRVFGSYFSATDNLYVDADRGGSDSPVDGELGLGDDETRISRIRWDAGNARLIFNDNNLPQDLDLSTYFGAGGDGNDLTFYVTDFSGTYTFNIADNILASGANFLQFSSLSATLVTIFDDISVGDRLARYFRRRGFLSQAVKSPFPQPEPVEPLRRRLLR